jgi:hypothetical protein
MSKFFGNCNDQIDWDDVIAHLTDNEPGHRFCGKENTQVDERNPIGTLENKHEHMILQGWRDQNFDFDKINWSSYSDGVHYSKDLVNKVAEILNLKEGIVSSWISCTLPGDCCPAHWDLDSHETVPDSRLVRYHIHMSAPVPGQIFVIENEVFHMKPQGDIYLWDSRRQYHSASNSGFKPQYLFHCECYI